MRFLFKFLKRIRIRSFRRFVPFTTTYLGFLCVAVDKSSFLFMHDEIFEKEIYKFEPKAKRPFIIDCGANIGLQIVYFKRRFPDVEILAFEPDPVIFQKLQENVRSIGAEVNTICVKACLTSTAGEVKFYPDGADGGTMSYKNSHVKAITVPAVRLDTYITKTVDFLKMDIEGAEYEVLNSIAHKLHLVERIFVEYHSFSKQTQHLDDILTILKVAGFRYYIEHTGIRSDEPYIKRSEDHGMDMQVNIY